MWFEAASYEAASSEAARLAAAAVARAAAEKRRLNLEEAARSGPGGGCGCGGGPAGCSAACSAAAAAGAGAAADRSPDVEEVLKHRIKQIAYQVEILQNDALRIFLDSKDNARWWAFP